MAAGDWARLRVRMMQIYNPEVDAHFGNTGDWVQTGNSKTRVPVQGLERRDEAHLLCLIGETDSSGMVTARQNFFYNQCLGLSGSDTVFGTPKTDFDSTVIYNPTVYLQFKQDPASVPTGTQALSSEISFRLMSVTSQTIKASDINDAATLVYNAFFATPISYSKGKVIAWYTSPADGLHLQIYSLSETEGLRIAKVIVAGVGKTWSDDYYRATNPSRDNVKAPADLTILGNTNPAPRWRPNVNVNIIGAKLVIWGDGNKSHNLVRKNGNTFIKVQI